WLIIAGFLNAFKTIRFKSLTRNHRLCTAIHNKKKTISLSGRYWRFYGAQEKYIWISPISNQNDATYSTT
ncbi:MAG: hypothetical protein ACOVLE_08740, partial [Pirellula staleyi]